MGKDGTDRLLLESPYYVAQYRDGAKRLQVVKTGCRDEQAARRVLADLERRAELVRANVVSASELAIGEHRGTPLDCHFSDYLDHLRAQGVTAHHCTCTKSYLARLAPDCSFGTLADLTEEGLERWLSERAAEGVAARTRNAYRDAAVAFGNWCVGTRPARLERNPFARIGRANHARSSTATCGWPASRNATNGAGPSTSTPCGTPSAP